MFSRLDELEALNPSFKIDSVVTDEFDPHKYDNSVLDLTTNTSEISEITNENVIEYSQLPVNDYWYSKPIVMNFITQQIFFQLFTENNGMLLKNVNFFFVT